MDIQRSGVRTGLTVVGELSAAEDLLIEGRVEGAIMAAEHHVTLGATGSARAKIVAKAVTLSGSLEGSIIATERVRVLDGANLRGHVTTPSLMLADGAIFNGSVDPERTEAAMLVAKYRQRRGDEPG